MKNKIFGATFSSIADFAAACDQEEPLVQPVVQGKTETPEARQEDSDSNIVQTGSTQ